LGVCARLVITPERCRDLLARYPELRYAVLMTWVPGETWQELIARRVELGADQSRSFATSFARTLSEMEARSIAHCDLSGSNVLATLEPPAIGLVDIEELYAPTLTRPERIPAGSAGYAHRLAQYGLWQPDADRFAAAVLLAEMLGGLMSGCAPPPRRSITLRPRSCSKTRNGRVCCARCYANSGGTGSPPSSTAPGSAKRSRDVPTRSNG
jgi:hypothetical protein